MKEHISFWLAGQQAKWVNFVDIIFCKKKYFSFIFTKNFRLILKMKVYLDNNHWNIKKKTIKIKIITFTFNCWSWKMVTIIIWNHIHNFTLYFILYLNMKHQKYIANQKTKIFIILAYKLWVFTCLMNNKLIKKWDNF